MLAVASDQSITWLHPTAISLALSCLAALLSIPFPSSPQHRGDHRPPPSPTHPQKPFSVHTHTLALLSLSFSHPHTPTPSPTPGEGGGDHGRGAGGGESHEQEARGAGKTTSDGKGRGKENISRKCGKRKGRRPCLGRPFSESLDRPPCLPSFFSSFPFPLSLSPIRIPLPLVFPLILSFPFPFSPIRIPRAPRPSSPS